MKPTLKQFQRYFCNEICEDMEWGCPDCGVNNFVDFISDKVDVKDTDKTYHTEGYGPVCNQSEYEE